MQDIATLLQAVAALLWPIFAFVALFTFKEQLRSWIVRLRKGKILGQEFELEEKLERLEHSASAAEDAVSEQPIASPSAQSMKRDSDVDAAIQQVVDRAATAPEAALLSLSVAIERTARQLLASVGKLEEGRRHVPIKTAIRRLEQHGLPNDVARSLELFWDVRNKMIHGSQSEVSNSDIIRAIDSGVAVLKALNAVPHERNFVHAYPVALFSDENGQLPVADAKGVLLKSLSADGETTTFRIFPTTREHFVEGQRVGWEWSFGKKWSHTWYRDPVSGQIKKAWDGAVEFVGRPIDQL